MFDPGTEIHQCLIGMEMSVVLGIPLGPAGDHVPGRIKVSHVLGHIDTNGSNGLTTTHSDLP